MLIAVFLGFQQADVNLNQFFLRKTEGDDKFAGKNVGDVFDDLVLGLKEIPAELDQDFLSVKLLERFGQRRNQCGTYLQQFNLNKGDILCIVF